MARLSFMGGGLEARLRQRQCDVLHLPEEETKVRDDDGRSECRKRNPVGVTHEPDGQEDEAEADQVAEQRGGHHQSERDAGGAGDDSGGESEVHEHDGDAVGARPCAVAAPDDGAHGDQHRADDQAALDHVARDLDLGRRAVEAGGEEIGGRNGVAGADALGGRRGDVARVVRHVSRPSPMPRCRRAAVCAADFSSRTRSCSVICSS